MVHVFLIPFLVFSFSIFSMHDTNKELMKAIQNHEIQKIDNCLQNREALSSQEAKELLLVAIWPYITNEVIQAGKRYSACIAIAADPKKFMEKALTIQKNCHIIKLIKKHSPDFLTTNIESVVEQVNDVYKPETIQKNYYTLYHGIPIFFGSFFASLKHQILSELQSK